MSKPRVRPCPGCGQMFDSERKYRKCDHCSGRLYEEFREDLKAATRQGRCQICRRETDHLVPDHDHSCHENYDDMCPKCFRGWICRPCNMGLGQFRDNPEVLRMAAFYLEHTRSTRQQFAGAA